MGKTSVLDPRVGELELVPARPVRLVHQATRRALRAQRDPRRDQRHLDASSAAPKPRGGLPPRLGIGLRGASPRARRRGGLRDAWSRTARRTGRSSLPSTPRAGLATTPSAAKSAASTTTRRATRPASRSWPAGTTPSSPSSNFEKSSWTAPVDAAPDPPTEDTATVTAAQVTALSVASGTPTTSAVRPRRRLRPLALSVELAEVRCEVLCRIRSTASSTPTQRAPARARSVARAATVPSCAWPIDDAADPDMTLPPASTRSTARVAVSAWCGLHPKLHGRGRWAGLKEPPIVHGVVIRVEVEHLPKPTGNGRVKKTLWLWWSGPGDPDLERCWRATCTDSTSSTRCAFSKGRSAGRPRGCAIPSRPTAGRILLALANPSSPMGTHRLAMTYRRSFWPMSARI